MKLDVIDPAGNRIPGELNYSGDEVVFTHGDDEVEVAVTALLVLGYSIRKAVEA